MRHENSKRQEQCLVQNVHWMPKPDYTRTPMSLPRSVWSLSALLVALGAGAAPLPLRAGEPEPGVKPGAGTVTLTHVRREVTGCHRVEEEGDSYCAAKAYAERTGETTVVLSPAAGGGPGNNINVSFPKASGKQSHETKVPAGNWQLVWKDGSTLREGFFVVPRDVFEITLESTLGVCEEAGDGCKLAPGKRQRRIEIPKVRGLTE